MPVGNPINVTVSESALGYLGSVSLLGFGESENPQSSGFIGPPSTTLTTVTVANSIIAEGLIDTSLFGVKRLMCKLAPEYCDAPFPAPTPASRGDASLPPHNK